MVMESLDYVTYALNQVALIKYLNIHYPKDRYQIFYLWNPFNLEYCGWGISLSDSGNPYSNPYYKTIYEDVKKELPDLKFKEEFFNKRQYHEEFFLQFLIQVGYKHPLDRKLRELMNPFSGAKIILHYDENDQPYILKANGTRDYGRKKSNLQ